MIAGGAAPAPHPGAGGQPEPGAAGAAGAGDARQQLTKEQKDQLHGLKQKRAKLKKAAAELSGSACGTAIKEDLERTQREIDKLDPRPIGVRLTKTEEALDKLVRQREHLKGIIRSTEDDKAKAEKQLEKLNAEEIGLLETKEQLREQLALHTVPGLVERERERAEQHAREAAEMGAATEARATRMAEMAYYIRDQAAEVLQGTTNPTYLLKEVLEKLEEDTGVQAIMHEEAMRRRIEEAPQSDVDFTDGESTDAEPNGEADAEAAEWMHREARGRLRRGLAPGRRILKLKLNKRMTVRRRRA